MNNTIKTIIIATGTFIIGAASSGAIMYKKGKRTGAQIIYKAGRTMYHDFDKKMNEYVKR